MSPRPYPQAPGSPPSPARLSSAPRPPSSCPAAGAASDMLSVEVPVISSEPDMSRFQILERGGAFVLNSLAFGFYTNILDVILCIDVLMPRAMHVRDCSAYAESHACARTPHMRASPPPRGDGLVVRIIAHVNVYVLVGAGWEPAPTEYAASRYGQRGVELMHRVTRPEDRRVTLWSSCRMRAMP